MPENKSTIEVLYSLRDEPCAVQYSAADSDEDVEAAVPEGCEVDWDLAERQADGSYRAPIRCGNPEGDDE